MLGSPFEIGGAGAGGAVTAAIQSISAGTTRITSGEVVFSNANGVSFGVDGQTVTASAVGGGGTSIGGIAAGTQTATSGTVVFSNSNGVSFGMSGSSRITATVDAIKSISAGTTQVTNGQVVFSNSNNVSFGMDGNTLTATASYSQSTAPGGLAAGTQTATSGTVVFSDSNGISFGMSGSTRVTATADYVRSISAGTTNATGNQIIFSNSNGVSFGANGATVTASVAGGGGKSIGGIAAGTQTATSGTVVFSNSNQITFGMSNSSIVTASFGGYTATQYWDQAALSQAGISDAFMSIRPVQFPHYITATRLLWLGNMTNASGSSITVSGGWSVSVGIYTMSGSTASLASSDSRFMSWSSTAAGQSSLSTAYDANSGMQYRSVSLANWAITPGAYLLAFYFRSTQAGAGGLSAGMLYSTFNLASGLGGNSDHQIYAPVAFVNSFGSAMPASFNVTDTANYVRTSVSGLRTPFFAVLA